MLFRLSTIAACAALAAGCDAPPPPPPPPPDPVPTIEVPPPPPEPIAETAPPAAPPAPNRWCPPYPKDATPPPDAPTPEECTVIENQMALERRRADEKMLATAERDGDLPPFDRRTNPNPERGSWMQQLVPDRAPESENACVFTERPRSARPKNLVVQASSGNMDLLADGFVLGHDHAIGFVEAGFLENKPVIAVRKGMPDLWIEPKTPIRYVVLRIGADEFRCVRWTGRD